MSSLFAKIAARIRWTLLYGPLLSLMPARWRIGKLGSRYANWSTGTMISGGFECLLAVNFFCAWGFLPGSHENFLWVGMYFLADGAWRTSIAVFNGESAGTVLLELVDEARVVGRHQAWTLRHPAMPDVITIDDANAEWQLKIESSRTKPDWQASRMVLYGERYYRIESVAQTKDVRPFVYLLRSLPAGFPSLRVLRYRPDEVGFTSAEK
jgi:hypothetical protein